MEPEPLRIAFTTPEYVTEKYYYGGLAHYTHRAAKALARAGQDVHVVTLSETDESEFEHESVRVHRVRGGRLYPRFNQMTRHHLATATRFLDLSHKLYRGLRRLHERKPLGLVQFPNYALCGLVSLRRLKVPHVMRVSSYQPALNDATGVQPSLDSRAVERLEDLQFRLSPHVYAPGHSIRQMLARRADLHRVRVIHAPFYVETDELDDSVYERHLSGKQYLLFYGRFQLHKGIHRLAEALPRFLEQYPAAHVALVGLDMPTALAPSMADYVRALCGPAAAGRLFMPGSLRHAQLYPIIKGARLVVLPSLLENFPNACLEAAGLGKVVVGTVGTGVEELIDEGETGFLVPPDDAGALGDAIVRAWAHPNLARMGEAARLKVSEFAPERVTETLLEYYREVLGG